MWQGANCDLNWEVVWGKVSSFWNVSCPIRAGSLGVGFPARGKVGTRKIRARASKACAVT